MDKVRIGIVGMGNMGTEHAKYIYRGEIPQAELAAVCDIKPERLKAAEEASPGISAFLDYDEMLSSGKIDAVIVATPHYEHPPQSIKALKKKIHVMCEKPIGVYTKHAAELIKAADEMGKQGVVFGIMYNERTSPIYKKIKEMVDGGELGKIIRTNWIITSWFRSQRYYDSGGWRATWSGEGGGVLINQAPHQLDLWQWICGMPSKVMAFCGEGKWHDIEVEDDVTAYVTYPNGATGLFVTSTGEAPGTNRFEITGDNGKMVCEDDKLVFFKNKQAVSYFIKNSNEGFKKPDCDEIEIKVDGDYPRHKGVVEAFANKILGKGELIAGGNEGINGLALSNAMHLSSWLGREVHLPIDEDLFLAELQKRIGSSKTKENVVEEVAADMTSSRA